MTILVCLLVWSRFEIQHLFDNPPHPVTNQGSQGSHWRTWSLHQMNLLPHMPGQVQKFRCPWIGRCVPFRKNWQKKTQYQRVHFRTNMFASLTEHCNDSMTWNLEKFVDIDACPPKTKDGPFRIYESWFLVGGSCHRFVRVESSKPVPFHQQFFDGSEAHRFACHAWPRQKWLVQRSNHPGWHPQSGVASHLATQNSATSVRESPNFTRSLPNFTKQPKKYAGKHSL